MDSYLIEVLQASEVVDAGLSEDCGPVHGRDWASEVVIRCRDAGDGLRWYWQTRWTQWRRIACVHGWVVCR